MMDMVDSPGCITYTYMRNGNLVYVTRRPSKITPLTPEEKKKRRQKYYEQYYIINRETLRAKAKIKKCIKEGLVSDKATQLLKNKTVSLEDAENIHQDFLKFQARLAQETNTDENSIEE